MPENRSSGQRGRVNPHRIAACLGLVLLGLAACQTLPEPSSPAPQAIRAPLPQAVADQTTRYAIVPDLSDVRFLVYRAGTLARLGHNHVIQARQLRGEIRLAPEIHRSSFAIEIPVKEFLVDAKEARREEGEEFTSQPDDEAVAGTTRNMLGEKVLDADRYPVITISSVSLNGPAWAMDVTTRIRLHGVERDIVVPTAIETNGGRLTATAVFRIKQTDFGITALSILGGAIRVDDAVKIRMRIVAEQDRASLPAP